MSIKESPTHVDNAVSENGKDSGLLSVLKEATLAKLPEEEKAQQILVAFSDDPEWSEEEDRKLLRKIDWKLMPWLFLTYGLQYYDKAMLSQAAIFGLREDLGLLTGDRYSMTASIFYIGFIAGAVPAMLLAQRFPLERVAFGIIFAWGVCLLCTIACEDFKGIYAQRFFLGFLEAGISPMFMLICSGFYKKDEQAFRIGIWFSATGFVALFTPLVNYGLGHITSGPLASWKYMYLLASCLTILWSFLILFFMPTDPLKAKGFTERERYVAISRIRVNNAGLRNTHFKSEHALEVLIDVRFWLSFCMAILIMIANGPVSTFLPIVIRGFGYSPLTSLLLLMPTSFMAGFASILFPLLAYKLKGWRTWLLAISVFPTIVAAALLWKLPRDNKGGLMVAVTLLGTFAAPYSVLMTLLVANTAGYTKKSITSAGLFLGYCLGNIIGPLVFKTSEAPIFATGFTTVLCTSTIACVLSVCYRYVCVWENRRRNNSGIAEGFENAFNDDLTDMKNPQFRYIL